MKLYVRVLISILIVFYVEKVISINLISVQKLIFNNYFLKGVSCDEEYVDDFNSEEIEERWMEVYLDHFNIWNNNTFFLVNTHQNEYSETILIKIYFYRDILCIMSFLSLVDPCCWRLVIRRRLNHILFYPIQVMI